MSSSGGDVCAEHPDHFEPCSKCAGVPCCPPEPAYRDDDVTVYAGDCLDVLRTLEDCSVDAVCTDPPYGLGFMGHEWDQPGFVVPDDRAGVPPGQRRRVNPATSGFDREGGAGAKEAGRYDLSRTANQGYQQWCESWAVECLRVLRPGGHLLAFGGARTYHRLACAIEDAGFELRDSIDWIFGSGFPKSLDIGKAVDRQLGADRPLPAGRHERVPRDVGIAGADGNCVTCGRARGGSSSNCRCDKASPAVTDQAKQWAGWGSALKPAHEPIVVARKPFPGTLVGNVLEHGNGALNIDATRVAWGEGGDASADRKAAGYTDAAKRALGTAVAAESPTGFSGEVVGTDSSAGRWPANVVLTHSPECVHVGRVSVGSDMHYPAVRGRGGISVPGHAGQDGLTERAPATEVVDRWDCAEGCPVRELDAQSGVLTSGANPTRRGADKFRDAYGEFKGQAECTPARGANTGGASRFFPVFRYEAKATTDERPRDGDVVHPTVKPLELMRWLVRLVVPRGATVLDCFAGSGTTGEACIIEGMRAILIEREPAYLPLIVNRVSKPIATTLDLDMA